MKKSQREPVVKIDEFEDLTLFANESFDTQDVDLFEFSSEESSPLTRLKSIILSLDWEINDDILQELADELETLQAMWTDDKVAEVYLQGLIKLGGYLRTRGAYAHPNSIKLLLTFFYNFEKIISSQNISGEEIAKLLKGDVRKFRILQYQINQSELEFSPPVVEPTVAPTPLHPQESAPRETADHAKQLKAAILSLDWEVTDDSLKQFNTKLSRFHGEVVDNKGALVLIQGLQALGDYIAEERANAHPEAFILLHSFNDALEQVAQLTPETLGPEEKEGLENILVDQINRLNNLKMLIAAPAQPSVDEQHIDEIVDQISTPAAMADTDMEPASLHEDLPSQPTYLSEDFAIEMDQEATEDSMDSTLEAELDTLFSLDAKPAMESAEIQYPDEILPPDAIHPVDDNLADDFIEAQLSDRRGLQPALSDTDELAGYSEDAEPLDLPAQSDLAEQLDFLFSDTEDDIIAEETPLSPLGLDVLEPGNSEDAEPVAALAAFEPEQLDQSEQFPDADALTGENDQVLAALADSEWPGDAPDRSTGEADSDQSFLDIQNKLDDFFADTTEDPSEPKVSAADGVEEVEQALFFTEENGIESALADSTEERGFSEEEAINTLDYTPLGEIEEKLDFFFGSETDEEPDTEVADELTMAAAAKEDHVVAYQDDVPALFTDDIREEEAVVATREDDTTPALADVDDLLMEEVVEAPGLDELDRELEGKLDFFFDADEAPIAAEEPVGEPVDALTKALEAAFDDEQPATVDLSEDEPVHLAATEEDKQIHLATLGALLPGIVRAASREQAAESTRLIEALNTIGLSAEHRSLLQMLDSVISLLARLPVQDGVDTEKLVNYLYEQLLERECRPEVLTTAVLRFTTWLQQASALMPLVPAAAAQDEDNEPHFAYTAKELYFELAELRAHIKDEFAKLRHEIHHHKS